MNVAQVIPILNVSDLAASFEWFAQLGWERRWDYGDPPDFGAVGNGGNEIFLCLNGQGGRAGGNADEDGGNRGVWMSWFLTEPAEVDEAHARAVREGVTVTQPPIDFPWNMRECHFRHPDGHFIRAGAPIEAEEWVPPREPRLVVERVDVPVRLERRLAAALADLASFKGMSLTECLEETLLHTFEPLRGGVASPHTPRQLRHIQELKRRHRIDYDCHASYRFAEES
jgi:predicted lactoylglutathione lyase